MMEIRETRSPVGEAVTQVYTANNGDGYEYKPKWPRKSSECSVSEVDLTQLLCDEDHDMFAL